MLLVSHKMDCLVDSLAKQLFSGDVDPFKKRWIVLPSRLNQQWLFASLAKKKEKQALVGLEMMSWREAILRSSREIPTEFELRLALAEILEDPDLPSSFAPLKEWMAIGPSRKGKLARMLSRSLSDAGFYGLNSDKEWQRDLIRLLQEKKSWRFFDQMADEIEFQAEIHLFAIDEMPKKAWERFLKNGAFVYRFSPCSMYWGDLCSDRERTYQCRKWEGASNIDELECYLSETHPLLANWGKIGQRETRIFEEMECIEAYEGCEEPETLLQQLQQDVLELKTEGLSYLSDDSIEVVAAGGSKLSELKILRKKLAAYFKKTDCDPSDVLVLAPDIKSYASTIRFVFGDEMPHRIAPMEGLSANLSMQGLLLFLHLAKGRWDADQVFELFENRSFRDKHQLTTDDLDYFRSWMRDARVRGGWEGRQGNWSEGLARLVVAISMLSPDDEIRNLDLGQAERLDRFLQTLEELRSLSKPFQPQEKRKLIEWASLLSDLYMSLFLPQEGEKELFTSFLHQLLRAAETALDQTVSWQVIFSLLEDASESSAGAFQANLWQGVQFSSLQPGSIRPAKAIFLLGMQSESFPRKRMSGSFDYGFFAPDPSEVDRYLLLQALFAAKDYLLISYCQLSSEDGKPVEVALPIQELMQIANLKPTMYQPSLPDALSPPLFWPRAPVQEEKKRTRLDLQDLFLCAQNPWKFFLQKTLGIYLYKEPLFSDLRKDDFELATYLKRNILFASLSRPLSQVLSEKKHLLPPKGFGERARAKLEFESAEWKERLSKWGVDPTEIHSIRFSSRCKEIRPLREGWFEAPSLQFEGIELIGNLSGVISSGLLLEKGGTSGSLALSYWPQLLIYLLHTGKSSAMLYSLEKEKGMSWTVDTHAALRRYLVYVSRAEKSLSPLIRPWAETFLKKGFLEWSQKAHETLQKEEDRWIRWVRDRASPCPLESIWEEWGESLRETFQEIL